jgi:hypothetical protein
MVINLPNFPTHRTPIKGNKPPTNVVGTTLKNT